MTKLAINSLAVFAIAALCIPCWTSSAGPSSTTASTNNSTQRLSPTHATTMPENLDGMRFISTELHEVGIGPGGVAMGHWFLEFYSTTCSWQHSDVVNGFAYQLQPDGTIKATYGDKPLTGRYYPDRKEVLLDGFLYKAQ